MSKIELSGARILLIIGGGVAAYKSLDLIRRLRERGASVQAIMTEAAKRFVSPLSAAAVSGKAVRDDLFSLTDEAEMGHIELSRSADLIVVAPATADLLAKMANGLASDLASTTLLATDKRVLVAPAMNVRMWLHPATQRNVAQLRADGVAFVGPDEGEMACGEVGPGRMAEPMSIVDAVSQTLATGAVIPLPGADIRPQPLANRRIIVTAGPTHEPIDPVRFIGNRSSGLQGYAIAQAAACAGADVTLISGPVSLPAPPGVKIVRVETAIEMLDAARAALPADVFIAAAAVADWRVENEGEQKLKKGPSGPTLRLVENPDILQHIGTLKENRPAIVVGFAAETEHLIDNARSKLLRKGCDLIVANDVSEGSNVFGGEKNQVNIVTQHTVESWPKQDKLLVAVKLIDRIVAEMGKSR